MMPQHLPHRRRPFGGVDKNRDLGDTPGRVPYVTATRATLPCMAHQKRTNGAGQPHKGDRRLLGTRLPRAVADEVEERALATGISISDYLSRLVADHLATAPLPRTGQGELVSRREAVEKSA